MVKVILLALAVSFALPWGISYAQNTVSPRSNIRSGSRGTTRIDNYYYRDRYNSYNPDRYYDEDKDRPMSRSERLKADQEARKRERQERRSIERQESIRRY